MQLSLVVLISVISSPLVFSLLGFLCKEKIKSFFLGALQADLQRQKHELDTLSEHLKFDLQRKMFEVQSALKSKQVIYPELYKLFLIVEGGLLSLDGVRYKLDESQYNEKDLEEIMTRRNVVDGTKQRILQTYSSNKQSALKDLGNLLRDIDASDARKSFAEAKNCFLVNQFYLSTIVEEKSNAVIDAVANLTGLLMTKLNDPSYTKDTTRPKENVKAALQELKVAMRNELVRD